MGCTFLRPNLLYIVMQGQSFLDVDRTLVRPIVGNLTMSRIANPNFVMFLCDLCFLIPILVSKSDFFYSVIPTIILCFLISHEVIGHEVVLDIGLIIRGHFMFSSSGL